MAAIPITIIGTITGKEGSENVTITGLATITGLEVGGGPIIPPGRPPIRPPVDPDAHPEHPIVLPPEGPPTEPPPGGGDKPPPDDGGWGFVAEWSKWGYFPGEGEAQPKARAHQTPSGSGRRG